MNNRVERLIKKYLRRHRAHRRKALIVGMISFFVVVNVLIKLTLPVVTMTPDPIEGSSPYARGEAQLICLLAEDEAHTHSEDCYAESSGDPDCPVEETSSSDADRSEPADVTISFVIDEPDYTNDPATGHTHLAANEAIEGGELVYSDWENGFKVTGTGKVCDVTIPAGTAPEENGLALPALSVVNIGSGNLYSFTPEYSWVDATDRVCDEHTVFSADTTLRLCLYESEEVYSLDFVCCEEHDASFAPYIEQGCTLKLGQCVASLPSVESMDYPEVWHEDRVLSGWQLKNTQTNELIPLTTDLPITADYSDEQYGKVIKCYAVWADPQAQSVVVAFKNGENTVASFDIEQGAALGDSIPTAPVKHGYFFLGWQAEGETDYADAATVVDAGATFSAVYLAYEDAATVEFAFVDPTDERQVAFSGYCAPGMPLGSAVDLNGERLTALPDAPEHETKVFAGWYAEGSSAAADMSTVITQNTCFTALFRDGYELALHDIDADGYEVGVIALTVAPDISIGEALADSDMSWDDGTRLADCVWYTRQAGETAPADLQAAIAADAELFTYSYRISLRLPETVKVKRSAASVTLTDDILTIECREGSELKASDFVVDGEDLSLYTWVKPDDTTITLSELIGTCVTEPLTLVRGDMIEGLTPHANKNALFYVFVDNERKLVASKKVTSYSFEDNRHYLSAALLESVYGEYGFSAEDMTVGTRYFPHTNKNRSDIWANTPVVSAGGTTFSPVTTDGNDFDVYYLPNQTLTASGSWASQAGANSFYTVQVVDTDNIVYPDVVVSTHKGGDQVVVTVPALEDYFWTCLSSIGGSTIDGEQSQDGDSFTFTIPAIDRPYVISTISTGEKSITYDINLPQEPNDSEYGTPTIAGKDHFSITVDADDIYVLLAPSIETYNFTHDTKYMGEASFLGWELNNSGVLYQPRDEIDLSEYPGKSLAFSARWETKAGGKNNKNGSIVNYFVSLASFPEDASSIEGYLAQEQFTDSVYVSDCGVNGIDVKNHGIYDSLLHFGGHNDQYCVLGSTDTSDIYHSHETLTTELTAGYSKEGFEEYVFRVSFPSDEEVLQQVRKEISRSSVKKVTINGHTLHPEDITPDILTVKWNVFKWAQDDGWHIDGYLIARKGVLRVQKSFGGFAEAIAAVKDGDYSITVEPGVNEFEPVHPGGTYWLSDAKYHYPETNTYIWEIDTDLYYNYNVRENNYIFTGSNAEECTTSAWYRVVDPITSEQATDWLPYNGDIGVTGRDPREGGGALTVMLENLYIPSKAIVLQKVGAASGAFMSGIEFTIERPGVSDFALYSLSDNHYTDDASAGGTPTNTIITDNQGQVYLTLTPGTYTLTETMPEGYLPPGTITFDIEESSAAHGVIGSASAQNGSQFVRVRSQAILEISNYSHRVPLTVRKTWLDGEDTPVTLQLFRNNVSMGHDYCVTLDGVTDEHEVTPWQCTFPELPLRYGNAPAEYSVREEAINGFHISEEYEESGYKYYDVSYGNLVYYDEDDQVTDIAHAERMSLEVENRRITHELVLFKHDENGAPVNGALFRLFLARAEEGDINVIWDGKVLSVNGAVRGISAESSSDNDGIVNFGSIDAGMYYLIESLSPDGYHRNDIIYRVDLDSKGRVDLKETHDAGATWEPVTNNTVMNVHIVGAITVLKHDEHGSFLPGSVFRLQHRNSSGVFENYGADFAIATADGVTLSGLPYGDYRLCEVTAPTGYYKRSAPIEFFIGNDGAEYTPTDDDVSFSGGTFTVVNHPGSLLPRTGGTGTAFITVAVNLLIMAGLVLYLRRKRNIVYQ